MLLQGDCLEVLKTLNDKSFDSLVTDPPAGISFMGKAWDGDKGGRDQWIAWMAEVMREVLRVLKPGAHGLVWALPRTSHWTATALEDAGFEVRDVIHHLFGSGFPKSLNVSKAIDNAAGATREVTGIKVGPGYCLTPSKGSRTTYGGEGLNNPKGECEITAPFTTEAAQWDGWGTALKPAVEHYILVRKPMSEKTVASNVLKHGTGAINIDASRVGNGDDRSPGGLEKSLDRPTGGRFPANLVLSHNPDCEQIGTREVKTGTAGQNSRSFGDGNVFGTCKEFKPDGTETYGEDGKETVPDFRCTEGCPVAALELHASGTKGTATKNESKGGVSRFFYCTKASRKDKNSGCEDLTTWENLGQSLVDQTVESSQHLKATLGSMMPQLSDTEWNTLWSGNNTTEQFQRDTISTIKTITKPIMTFQTLNVLANLNTKENTLAVIRMLLATGLSLATVTDYINWLKQNITNVVTESLLAAVHVLVLKLLAIMQQGKIGNVHSTVKNTKLMEYLIRMVTPPNGRVLDPFMGSGSTGVAAKRLGFQFVGIELSSEYFAIAEKRVGPSPPPPPPPTKRVIQGLRLRMSPLPRKT